MKQEARKKMGELSAGFSFRTCDICSGPRGDNGFYKIRSIKLDPGKTLNIWEYDEVCQSCFAFIDHALISLLGKNKGVSAHHYQVELSTLVAKERISADDSANGP